jgi:hypothetical protein
VARLARERYPNVSLREGFRLAARDDFTLFTETTLGRVVLAAAGDARSAMLAMGTVYTKMAPGDWQVIVEEVGPDVRVRWENIPGLWEYQLGQAEGLVQSYGTIPRILVSELGPRRIQFDIALT